MSIINYAFQRSRSKLNQHRKREQEGAKGGEREIAMANNGCSNGLNVRFDLISINQLAVRKLSKRIEGERSGTGWGEGKLSILLAALENAVATFVGWTINQRVADFKVATICGTTTQSRRYSSNVSPGSESGQGTWDKRRQAGDTSVQLATLAAKQLPAAKLCWPSVPSLTPLNQF